MHILEINSFLEKSADVNRICFSNPFIVVNICDKFHKYRITVAVSKSGAEGSPSSRSP